MSGTLSSKDPGCIFVADDQYHEEENKKEIKPVAKKMKLPAAKKMKLSDALQKISAGDVNDNLDSNVCQRGRVSSSLTTFIVSWP